MWQVGWDSHVWTYSVPSASQAAHLWIFAKTLPENHHCHAGFFGSQIRKPRHREVGLAKVTQQGTLGSSRAGIPAGPAF